MSILVVGTVALDTIETPFGTEKNVLGGSATYIALAARYFTQDVRLMAVVGRDFPDEYMSLLKDSGVDLRGLESDLDAKTFAWEGRYHYDLNERDTIATHLNVLQSFDPVVPEAYRDSEIVCLGNLDPSIQRRALEQVREPRLVVCDTMNFWIQNTPDALQETLKLVDCLIINDAEARELVDEPNLVRAARTIRDLGPDSLIIKKGEHGALLFMDDVIFSAPAYPLEDIVDPTGAGDTFAGGFVGCLAREDRSSCDGYKQAVVVGSALASFCVERFGPQRLLGLSEEEIQDRIQAFRELSAIPAFSSIYAA